MHLNEKSLLSKPAVTGVDQPLSPDLLWQDLCFDEGRSLMNLLFGIEMKGGTLTQ